MKTNIEKISGKIEKGILKIFLIKLKFYTKKNYKIEDKRIVSQVSWSLAKNWRNYLPFHFFNNFNICSHAYTNQSFLHALKTLLSIEEEL